MATFEESFLYPLILLLVGAGVSGVLVSYLTNRWQDRRRQRDIEVEDRRKERENELEDRRQKQQNELEDRRKEREIEVERKRKELEIKADILSKIQESSGSALAKVIVSTRRKKPISNIDEVLEKFVTDGFIVSSMFQNYYSSETDILSRWAHYFASYTVFMDATSKYFVKDPTEDEKSSLESHLNEIKDSFSDNKEINWDGLTADMPYDEDLWEKINDLYSDQVAKIVTDILKLPIKVS